MPLTPFIAIVGGDRLVIYHTNRLQWRSGGHVKLEKTLMAVLPARSRLDRGAAMAESWQPTLMGTLLVVDPPHAAVELPWMLLAMAHHLIGQIWVGHGLALLVIGEEEGWFLKMLSSPCLPYLAARCMVLLPLSGLTSPLQGATASVRTRLARYPPAAVGDGGEGGTTVLTRCRAAFVPPLPPAVDRHRHLPSTAIATCRRSPVRRGDGCSQIEIDGEMAAIEKDNGGEPVAVFC
ncbi:hypothetical protein ACLOJK_004186 [Asimina triloba]